MSDLIPDEERAMNDEVERRWPEAQENWEEYSVEEIRDSFREGWRASAPRVSPVTETADYLFENPGPQPVSKEWLAEVENTKSGAEVVSSVTREDVQELIAEVRNYADKYRDNYQIKLADVMVRAAGALESLSVSPPAEVTDEMRRPHETSDTMNDGWAEG